MQEKKETPEEIEKKHMELIRHELMLFGAPVNNSSNKLPLPLPTSQDNFEKKPVNTK